MHENSLWPHRPLLYLLSVIILIEYLNNIGSNFGATAIGINVRIQFHHEESFEVRGTHWGRERRSADDQMERTQRSSEWSADALAGQESDVEWDVATHSPSHKVEENKDYEVVDLTKKGEEEELPWYKKLRVMFLVPAMGIAVIIIVICYYQVCLQKKACTCCCDIFPCCACLHPKKLGRAGVGKYVPGVVIHEDEDRASYYEITEKEQQAMEELAQAAQ